MNIWFWMVNAPAQVAQYTVNASGSWGSASRSGFLPQSYDNFIDVGSSGTISVVGWDSNWNRIDGGTQSYTGLVEGGIYNIDFQTGRISPKEAPPGEETPPEEFPTWAKGVAMFWPWSPLFGPPLPKGFFPPWPMWMSRWTEIPGYPKIPS